MRSQCRPVLCHPALHLPPPAVVLDLKAAPEDPATRRQDAMTLVRSLTGGDCRRRRCARRRDSRYVVGQGASTSAASSRPRKLDLATSKCRASPPLPSTWIDDLRDLWTGQGLRQPPRFSTGGRSGITRSGSRRRRPAGAVGCARAGPTRPGAAHFLVRRKTTHAGPIIGFYIFLPCRVDGVRFSHHRHTCTCRRYPRVWPGLPFCGWTAHPP